MPSAVRGIALAFAGDAAFDACPASDAGINAAPAIAAATAAAVSSLIAHQSLFRSSTESLVPNPYSLVSGFFRHWPYISSSTNSTHLKSMSWTFFSSRR